MTETKEQNNGQADDAASGNGSGYNPHRDPIGSEGKLRQLLEHYQERIEKLLPKHLSVSKMIDLMLVAANKSPEIYDCTGHSIYQTVREASELGLSLSGSLGEAWPIVFRNNREEIKECQLMIGWRGFVKLAYQTGQVKRIESEIVHENDIFVFRKGMNPACDFTPLLKGNRGDKLGVYALVELMSGGVLTEWMSAEQVMAVRNQSKSKNSSASPWNGPFETEMWRKSAWRRLSKWTSLSSDKYDHALEVHDREFEFAEYEDVTNTAKADALAARLLHAKQAPEITPEDFTRARQQTEQREAVPAKPAAGQQSQSSQGGDPKAASEPQHDVAGAISKMQIETELCSECQSREEATRCAQAVRAKYQGVTEPWPAAAKEQFAQAYMQSVDVVDKAFKKQEQPAEPVKDKPEGDPPAPAIGSPKLFP